MWCAMLVHYIDVRDAQVAVVLEHNIHLISTFVFTLLMRIDPFGLFSYAMHSKKSRTLASKLPHRVLNIESNIL